MYRKYDEIRRIASTEEMFHAINAAHHGGEKKTFREAQNKWATLHRTECHKKRARTLPKSLVVKPLVSTNEMS
ncbi:hypothetical protein T4D_15333 [Trichinella pseudospiralis]|uniref:Uncharacterized protein n=1 Tax=Trichinella pseudospiralis TaxID=6337 RepID=A0A0V1F611_TRIPS|nr:hypothetical protein T4D_15333 [Trichinella pseudospiralis]